MSGTPFDFLKPEFPQFHEEAVRAGEAARRDPRASCFYARRGVELAVKWAYAHDRDLGRPYDTTLGAHVNSPDFKRLVGQAVHLKVREVVKLGNRAVHHAGPISVHESVPAVSHLFEILYWFARTYAQAKPSPDLTFDPATLPPPRPSGPSPSTLQRIKELEAELVEADAAKARVAELEARNEDLAVRIAELRREVAAAKAAATATPDTHDYSESETRTFLIDLMLQESGWDLTEDRDREFEVHGMPNASGVGYADYVLWGDDGKPMAVIEAKRTGRGPNDGRHQAKLYADCLERTYAQRPVVLYSNGYESWLWDEAFYPPRSVQGFPARSELELMIQRRSTRRDLTRVDVDEAIAGRYYQKRAIARVCESFQNEAQRKALLVMATGAGKTRTVIALTDVLMRANWVKRVLFLADRTALVNQAVNAFKAHLPDASPVNLVTEKDTDGRVYVSTYPTMMNLIDDVDGSGRRRFGPNHFDLVVIDEAHRSVFHKYRAIFDYFDSLLVGLTATPRSEIEKNTYDLFDLETGVPTDEYGLEQAVSDGYLVPFRGVSVPLRFQRDGIRYDDLPEEEKEQWDELDWGEDDSDPPDEVSAAALNHWLFNADTVDKVLAHLMTNGAKVDGGARLGKTIVFARNQAHAEFIAQRFDADYPVHKGEMARVITHSTEYAQDLIDRFLIASENPRIAISVDMLDTGIDVPEVVNLVFFKPVRSKTKFWQMIGRGTRLCPDLLGPGADKDRFYVFDYCGNLEYFNQDPGEDPGSVAPTLAARTFTRRVELRCELDRTGSDVDLRDAVSGELRAFVGSLNDRAFVVRPHLRLVEKYRNPSAWEVLGPADAAELVNTVAHLPDELPAEPVGARQFDVLVLDTQLALLRGDARFAGLHDRIRTVASLLEAQAAVPVVAAQLDLLQDLQTDEWWTDVTATMLEGVRTRLRLLAPLIEKAKRTVVYTDFTDELGIERHVPVGGLVGAADFEQFRKKAMAFLRDHADNPAVAKLRTNQPITADDLAELEVVLIDAGVATPDDIDRAVAQAGALGVFVRSLVGLDRTAAKDLFAGFLDTGSWSGDQIEFVNLVIDELTANGVVPVRRFYESPYVDITPQGPEGLFPPDALDRLVALVEQAERSALPE